jgi:hypothetical protein
MRRFLFLDGHYCGRAGASAQTPAHHPSFIKSHFATAGSQLRFHRDDDFSPRVPLQDIPRHRRQHGSA